MAMASCSHMLPRSGTNVFLKLKAPGLLCEKNLEEKREMRKFVYPRSCVSHIGSQCVIFHSRIAPGHTSALACV